VNNHPIFFYFASVSKSLLIVLGTFPFSLSLPAKNCRGKCRNAGMERSRIAWTTRRTRVIHTSHRTTTTMYTQPAIANTRHLHPNGAGRAGKAPHPLLPVSMGVSSLIDSPSMIVSVFRSSAHCTAHAVCPCQGLRLNNLLLGLCVTCPDLICSVSRISLDNSYPPRSSRRLCGKQKVVLTLNRRNVLLGSAPVVRAGRATHLHRESVGDRMQNLIGRSERWNP
jgi:hypothetical protein